MRIFNNFIPESDHLSMLDSVAWEQKRDKRRDIILLVLTLLGCGLYGLMWYLQQSETGRISKLNEELAQQTVKIGVLETEVERLKRLDQALRDGTMNLDSLMHLSFTKLGLIHPDQIVAIIPNNPLSQ